jgi:hypothetical protein
VRIVLGVFLGEILVSNPVWAWFAEGHEIAAIIAADDLTPTARSHVAHIFGVPTKTASVEKEMTVASIRPTPSSAMKTERLCNGITSIFASRTRNQICRRGAHRGIVSRRTMNARHFLTVLLVVISCANAAPALAGSVDVCLVAADHRFDSTGKFFTDSAPVYPGGTIEESSSAIDCTKIAATPIGTFFTNGAIVSGLPASDPTDIALVTWHFRIGSRGFDTVGVVQNVAPGQTFPQTIVGSTHGAAAANGEATVIRLDPTGLVFEVTYPGSQNGQ